MKLKMLVPVAALMVLAAFTFEKINAPEGRCAACEQLTGVEKIVCLAEDFKASLTSSQISTLQLDYNLTNAKKWSNLPVTFVPRIGIRFGDLTADQLTKAKAVVQAAMGTTANEGYDEAQQLWAADQYLSQNGGGSTYGSGQYYMAFLGTPSTTGTWELQTGGHHLAVANTYSGGVLSGATPSFRAVEPFAAFQSGSNTYQPIVQERDALAAMLASLSTSELATAKLSTTYSDIVLGPGKDWQFPTTHSGIKCSNLTAAQKELVINAMRTYVEDIDAEDAADYMALYISQIDDTYISYANTPALSQQKDYVRIDGPRVWIEYSVQNGIVLSPTHPHSVWRDRETDYGGLGNPASATNAPADFTGKFTLAPNPADTNVQVGLSLDNAATVVVSIFDLNGKKLTGGFTYNMTSGEYTLPMNVSHLPAGSYHCVLEVKSTDGPVLRAARQLVKM